MYVCVFHVCSASAACGKSIIFPLSLERLGLYNLLVSQAHLLNKSGQRLDGGAAARSPSDGKKGSQAEWKKSRQGGGWSSILLPRLTWQKTAETHQAAGKSEGRCSHLWGWGSSHTRTNITWTDIHMGLFQSIEWKNLLSKELQQRPLCS